MQKLAQQTTFFFFAIDRYFRVNLFQDDYYSNRCLLKPREYLLKFEIHNK